MNSNWNYYQIYDIHLRSDIDLPGINEYNSGNKANVTIRYTDDNWPEIEPERYSRNVSDRRVELLYPDNIYLRITGGDLIEYMPLEGVSKDVVRQFLLCNALGVLLHHRKIPVLHASAVDVGGKAVLFLGDKGQGKSTTAAGFYANGNGLVSDDIVPIFGLKESGRPYTYYGPQQLRLLPDALEGIFGEDSNLYRRVETGHNKVVKPLDRSEYPSKKVYIHSILTLSDGNELYIESISDKIYLFNLINNLYTKNIVQGANDQRWVFIALNKIRKRISSGRLFRERNHGKIIDIVKLVENEIMGHYK